MIKILQIIGTLSIIVFMMWLSSCQEETVFSEPEIPLRFSLDTLRFDTVFTESGSATRFFKIYNDQTEAVIINQITLQDNDQFFRINADGIQGPLVEDTRIEPNDSIYVFTEVTIDPDMPLSVSPFFIERQVNIKANNSEYTIHLEAFGQNANYVPSRSSDSELNLVTCDMGQWVWDDPRPYVIYGALFIDSCELVIPEGQSVYVHGGVAINDLGIYNDGLLIMLENGSLRTQGTAQNPVLFKTDRLEEEFDQVSGQWAGILLSAGSTGNIMQHTNIENAIAGISVDSSASLRMESCSIGHTSGSGLVAAHANIYAENSLFYDNGSFGLSLNFGGNYTFNYCTVANYDNQDNALFLNNFRCYGSECELLLLNQTNAQFNNCILIGNDEDEIALADASDGAQGEDFFNYRFENCIFQVDELLDANAFPNFFDRTLDCKNVERSDTILLDAGNFDYRLDTMSIAIDKGQLINTINFDIIGNDRNVDQPDIGCYEFQK